MCQQDNPDMCAYYGENRKYTKKDICNDLSFKSTTDIEKVIEDILKKVGLERNFIVIECDGIENCLAVNLPGKIGLLRYLIFDNAFLSNIEIKTQNKWSKISILAHEIGHHLQGHTLDGLGSRPSVELQADKFSGFILAKLGASLKDSQSAIEILQSEFGSSTHPAKGERLFAIETGWKSGKNESYVNTNNNSKIEPDINSNIVKVSPREVYKNDLYLIEYGSPSKKGRNIFGDLIPYGQVWRTGANKSTEITFYTDVLIEGAKVKAGTYTLFSIPNPSTWTIILNPNLNQWGSYSYEKIKNEDILRVNIKPIISNNILENMIIDADYENNVLIKWDNIIIKLQILKN
jgi:Protein of unknown function (DUF2911)